MYGIGNVLYGKLAYLFISHIKLAKKKVLYNYIFFIVVIMRNHIRCRCSPTKFATVNNRFHFSAC